MRDLSYNAKCNLLIDVQKSDRFYMDMRVYEIVDPPVLPLENNLYDLVWRGIVLAIDAGPLWPGVA